MIDLNNKKLLELASRKEYWKTHPEDFMKEMLDFELPIHQRNMLKHIVKYSRISICSANSVGKSRLLSAIAVWFFFCYLEPNPRESTIVIFTAPTFEQVKVNIFNNIKDFIATADAKLQKEYDPNITFFGKISEDKNRAEITYGHLNYMSGVSSSGENKVVGKHAKNVLIIYDEAQGIEDSIFSDFRGIVKGGRVVKEIMIGNSTLPQGNFGRFYESFQDNSTFKKITISAFDTPAFIEPNILLEDFLLYERDENYWRNKLDRFASKFYGRKISYYDYKKSDDIAEWEVMMKDCLPFGSFLVTPLSVYDELVECGFNINSYEFLTRVLARFPLGVERSAIPTMWVNQAIENHKNDDCWEKGEIVMGIDVGGGSGADDSAIAIRNGNKLIYCEKFNLKIVQLIEKIVELFEQYNVDRIQIESDGIGEDKRVLLENAGLPVVGIQSGGSPGCKDTDFVFDKAKDTEIKKKYNRKRDEVWWNFRSCLNPLRPQLENRIPILLPDDRDIKKELSAITYDDTGGKIRIIPKDKLRLILKGSPNKADSCVFAFADSGDTFTVKHKFGGFSVNSNIDRNIY